VCNESPGSPFLVTRVANPIAGNQRQGIEQLVVIQSSDYEKLPD